MPSKKKVEQKVVREPIDLVPKKKEATAVLSKADTLKAVALLVDVIPEDKYDVLCGVFEKALFKETTRHYVTKAELELRKDLTVAQVKKFNEVINTLVKVKIVAE